MPPRKRHAKAADLLVQPTEENGQAGGVSKTRIAKKDVYGRRLDT
jgi:hypothetical protein